MQISTRTRDDVTIVAVVGNLDSITSAEAQQAFDAVLAAGARKIAIDFSALDYISSAGLRVMLGVAKQLRASGGALRVHGDRRSREDEHPGIMALHHRSVRWLEWACAQRLARGDPAPAPRRDTSMA